MHRRSATGTRATIREAQGRFFVRWFADDPDTWRDLLDDFKRAFPLPGQRSFHPATKEWALPGYQRPALGAWLRANFALDAIQWLNDDEREPERERPNSTAMASIDAAYDAMQLRRGAPLGLAEAAYRWWSRQYHPDAGGTHEAFVSLGQAIDVIREHAPSGAA